MLMRWAEHVINTAIAHATAPGQPSLRMERGADVLVEDRAGYLFGIGQVLDERKPTYREYMQFVIVDPEDGNAHVNAIVIYPVLYRLDPEGVEEESCRIVNGAIVSFIALWQRDHARYALNLLARWQSLGYRA